MGSCLEKLYLEIHKYGNVVEYANYKRCFFGGVVIFLKFLQPIFKIPLDCIYIIYYQEFNLDIFLY